MEIENMKSVIERVFDNNEDIKPKDKIECYEVKEIKKKI